MNLRALEIIYRNIDPWTMEDHESSKDKIFAGIMQDIKDGISFPFEKDGMVFYVMPETKFRAKLHLFSETKDVKTTLQSARDLTAFMFDNIASLEKIYGITPHLKMIKVANRVGWKQEGLLKDSFYSKSGAMKNQYIFGITRKDFACQTHGTQCAKATS
jgi:hypothetical protein